MDHHTPNQSLFKRCSRCKTEKPVSEFTIARRTKDGLNFWCRTCIHEYYGYGEKSLAYKDVPPGHKRCPHCKKVKLIAEYNKHHRTKDGLQTYCKDCQSETNGRSRRFNPYKNAPAGKKECRICGLMLPATPEYFSRGRRAKDGLRSECKSCQRAYKNEWEAANTEHTRRYTKNYRQANAERLKEATKQWWRENRLTKGRVLKVRREARKRSLPNDFTAKQWRAALEYFNGCCAVCGRPPGLWHTIAADHWIPMSKGGATSVTNIIPLCHGEMGCNNSKRDKLPDVWLVEKFGTMKAQAILKRIDDYLEWVEAMQ